MINAWYAVAMPAKKSQIPHIEVTDADEAMRKAEEFGRRILRIPKKTLEENTKKTKKVHR